jgi:hypothetical protein
LVRTATATGVAADVKTGEVVLVGEGVGVDVLVGGGVDVGVEVNGAE